MLLITDDRGKTERSRWALTLKEKIYGKYRINRETIHVEMQQKLTCIVKHLFEGDG